MRRREFITLVGGAAAWPFAAHAQQGASMRRVGVLFAAYSEADKAGQARIAAFTKSLNDLGWGENRIRIDYRWGAGNGERLRTLAIELIQSAPDTIIAVGDPALSQLKGLKSDIPIVFTQVSEPVDSGFVVSLARPGGNITGFQNFEPEMGGKWLGVLKEIAPNVKRVGILFSAAPHTSFFCAQPKSSRRHSTSRSRSSTSSTNLRDRLQNMQRSRIQALSFSRTPAQLQIVD
jgi:putative ABC transport system substrate-binding protein